MVNVMPVDDMQQLIEGTSHATLSVRVSIAFHNVKFRYIP